MMTEIFTAKSVDDAKALAVASFGVSESQITFDIIEQPKKGLFKMKGEAKVQASYEPPVIEEVKEDIISEVLEIKSEDTENYNPKALQARDYVASILSAMDINSKSTITENEAGAIINFDGDGTGAIIGRRGETLDALQYLASMICNKGEKDYYRITLDSCGYREKRRKTLEDLACKISKNVLRTGKSTALEPMNPYERRIIHSEVAKIEGVSSRSVGEEPYRKVIIASNSSNNNRNNYKKNDRKRDGGKDYKRKKNYDGPRSLDLKTSFEKDYKKPKPEDEMNAGLYGKIEF